MTKPISIDEAIASLTFLPDRTPTSEEDGWYDTLASYRDGAMFVAHYAGTTAWERHAVGDEIVLVVDGATTLILLVDDEEVAHGMSRGEFLVVPQGIWHRFETPDGVKLLSVTPQPTDHSLDRPLT